MDTDVLVVGAGPTGLFVAAELTRAGISTTVIDKGNGPSTHSKALAVHARTLDTFATRQFASDVVERGLPVRVLRIFAGGTERAQLSIDDIASPYPYMLSLPQSVTERLLIDQLDAAGGGVEWNTELVDARDEEDGVTAHLDGAGERTVRARWLVGCDGAHSRVRQTADFGWAGEDIDAHFALIDAEIRSDVIDRSTAQIFVLDDGRNCGFVPLPGGGQRIILTLTEAPDAEVDRAFFQDQLTTHVDPDLDVQTDEWASYFSVRQRVVDTYRQGRVCLAGDAAHAHSPVGGQGMNTDLQDAHNLAWKLAAVIDGDADTRLLDTYEAERRPLAEQVVRLTGRGTRLIGRQSWWLRILRITALTLLAHVDFLRTRFLGAISQTGVTHTDSPLVQNPLGQAAGSLRAGYFAPNLSLADDGALHDHLSPTSHVALIPTGAPVPPPLTETELLVKRISESTLHAHDGPSSAVIVVRPDGYVGYSGSLDDDRTLREYLAEHGLAPHR